MATITGRMIHDAFKATSAVALDWHHSSDATKAKYRQMALRLNELAELCPFCAFYEKTPQKIGGLCIADIPACTDCAEANQLADITEMLMQWYEEQS